MLWTIPKLGLLCGRRWLSRRSDGGGAPGDVDVDATLTLLSQRPMMFQDSEVEMQDRVGALGTAVDDVDDHDLPPECAKMLHDIVFTRTLTYSVGRCWATRLHAWSL